MALSLGTRFSGVILPISIAVSNFLELAARSIKEREGLGSALNSTRFSAVRALRDLIAGDDLQQLDDKLILFAF